MRSSGERTHVYISIYIYLSIYRDSESVESTRGGLAYIRPKYNDDMDFLWQSPRITGMKCTCSKLCKRFGSIYIPDSMYDICSHFKYTGEIKVRAPATPYLYSTVEHALLSRISACARAHALLNSASSFNIVMTIMTFLNQQERKR